MMTFFRLFIISVILRFFLNGNNSTEIKSLIFNIQFHDRCFDLFFFSPFLSLCCLFYRLQITLGFRLFNWEFNFFSGIQKNEKNSGKHKKQNLSSNNPTGNVKQCQMIKSKKKNDFFLCRIVVARRIQVDVKLS